MITIENKFNVGDECYEVVDTSTAEVHKCPVCEGAGQIEYKGYKMICGYCSGMGVRAVYYQPKYIARKVTIKKIVVTVKNGETIVIYRTDNKTHNKKQEADLFKTLEDAEEYCKNLESH